MKQTMTKNGLILALFAVVTTGLIALTFYGTKDQIRAQEQQKLLAILNAVVDRASYTNDIGDVELKAVWADPDFDPGIPAFYYIRVIEIPTPRWSTYDAADLQVDLPEDIPAWIQERAFASPFWYVPGQ